MKGADKAPNRKKSPDKSRPEKAKKKKSKDVEDATLDREPVGEAKAVDHSKDPTHLKDAAALKSMTAGAFLSYANKQADWALQLSDPKAGEDKDLLIELLSFMRSDPSHAVGLGTFEVNELVTAISFKDASEMEDIKRYCEARVGKRPTVDLEEAAPDVDTAFRWGTDLSLLHSQFDAKQLKTIMEQEQLKMFSEHSLVVPFMNYANSCKPVLHADKGAETQSYGLMHTLDGVDPASYAGQFSDPIYVRNFHRFEADVLDELKANQANKSKTLPVTLVVHSSLDHNGAFHRDPEMTRLFTGYKGQRLTLMIEGRESLGQITAQIPTLAKEYGVDDKLDQVLIAGHGDARSMEMAGSVEWVKGEKKYSTEDIDLDEKRKRRGKETETEKLLDAIVEAMPTDDDVAGGRDKGRIVLNACLTNSNIVDDPKVAPGERKKKRQEKREVEAKKKKGGLRITRRSPTTLRKRKNRLWPTSPRRAA